MLIHPKQLEMAMLQVQVFLQVLSSILQMVPTLIDLTIS